ncbi:class I SAM-dependent methyltransferase [Actinoplanes regularis]|uniref:class I SAM-dependent methyltransferase n=1 Tax=Actinoplanes regularis TaxID=52697 RepID=UPI002552B7B4|nr:class I SAM-dependent methyltransferase [Actinoplanes regularis]GLW27978.1 methyltransferase [Actinoplanes regularis]
MIDYDAEAADYDRTRGGEPRAAAAARAVTALFPASVRTVVDVACGTGIVTTRLAGSGRTVLGIDRTPAMLSRAATRLPGGVARADATALPLKAASVDAVVVIWLLHLLPDAAPVIAEAARVLRPGGVLITTVDKDEAPFARPGGDLAVATEPFRTRHAARRTDNADRVLALAAEHGLHPAGESAFRGVGQGRTPARWLAAAEANRLKWAPPAELEAVRAALTALPEQDSPRPDPSYRLLALRARTIGR